MVRIGIDIGGTKVNMGLVAEDGKILSRVKLPTASAATPRELVHLIGENISEMLRGESLTMEDVAFIGAGVPGTADVKTGHVSYCPNIHWIDVPLGEYFLEELGREVKVMQDSRNGALAEKLFGAGKAFSDQMCVTIGTGIGCGIILDGRVFHGAMNTAGELGHISINKHDSPCNCGNRGCLEHAVSGPAIARRAKERYPEKFTDREATSENVFAMANAGDAEMLALIDDCVDDLAVGIANAVALLSVEAVIISGGICVHENLVIKPLREKVLQHGYFSWKRQDRLRILTAELGSDAPMIGAAFIDKGI